MCGGGGGVRRVGEERMAERDKSYHTHCRIP